MVFCRADDRSLSRDTTLDERSEKDRNSTHIDTKIESSYLQCTCRKVIRAVRSPRGALGVLASFVGLFTNKGDRTVDNVMENCICVEQAMTQMSNVGICEIMKLNETVDVFHTTLEV